MASSPVAFDQRAGTGGEFPTRSLRRRKDQLPGTNRLLGTIHHTATSASKNPRNVAYLRGVVGVREFRVADCGLFVASDF